MTHKLGFSGLSIVCACGAQFGSRQVEAARHLRTAATKERHARERAASAQRAKARRQLQGAVRGLRLRCLGTQLALSSSVLALAWGVSERHARRILVAACRAGKAQRVRGGWLRCDSGGSTPDGPVVASTCGTA